MAQTANTDQLIFEQGFSFPPLHYFKIFVSMKNRVRDSFRTSGNRGVPSGCPMVTKNFLRSYGTPQDPHAKFQSDRYGGSSGSILHTQSYEMAQIANTDQLI